MERWLTSFRLATLLKITMLAPILYAAILGVSLVNRLVENHQQQLLSQEVLYLSRTLAGVAHEFAAERGRSAGFIGSGGQGRSALEQQREKADAIALQLERLDASNFTHLPSKQFNAAITPLSTQLKELGPVRSAVNQLNPDNGAFGFYSTLNAQALESIFLLAAQLKEPQARNDLEQLITLLWIKERAGQSRGALNGVFKQGRASPKRFEQVRNFLTSEANYLHHLELLAAPELQKEIGQLKSSDAWEQVAMITQQFLAQENRLEQIQGPQNWFDLATQRIQAVQQVASQLSEQVLARADSNAAQSQQQVWLLSALTLGIFLLLLFLAFYISHLTSKRVQQIRSVLIRATDHHDLTARHRVIGKDELADIGSSINALLTSLERVIGETHQHAEDSMQVAQQVSNWTEEAQEKAQQAHQQTDMIATAITEMSQTSAEVASNCLHAANATSAARDQGAGSQQLSHKATDAIHNLQNTIEGTRTTMETLNKNSLQIGTILDTISGIAEQTNLLALNAAIEAARAGEDGRGFAVVADEVRTLAQKSQQATEEIRNMIESLQQSSDVVLEQMHKSFDATNQSASAISQASDSMEVLFEHLDQLNLLNTQIAAAAEEQTTVSNDLTENVHVVAQLADQTHIVVERTGEQVNQMATTNADLSKQLQRFTIGTSQRSHAASVNMQQEQLTPATAS